MITLRRLVEADAPLLERLGNLYVYDLTDAFPLDPDEQGWYAERPRLPVNGEAWLALADGAVAGFAVVVPDTGWFLDDFFVLRRHRRKGVGTDVAHAVFGCHPGPWGLSVRADNLPALAFWRRTLARYGAIEGAAVQGADGNRRIRFAWSVAPDESPT